MEFKNKIELAEFFGIMMGDGGIYKDKLGKYQLNISFHKNEFQYLEYVRNKFHNLFFPYKLCISEQKSEYLLRNCSVKIGQELILLGLKAGNKVNNRLKIPDWILKNPVLTNHYIRGFFDTGGCIYRKYASYAQIQFKLGCNVLLNSIRLALINLGYNPTKIQSEYHNNGKIGYKFYLSRQNEVDTFFLDIKPKNKKHLIRYKRIKNGAAGI